MLISSKESAMHPERKRGGLNGVVATDAHELGILGEPVTIVAFNAAATAIIIDAVKILKDAGLFASGEDAFFHLIGAI